MNHNSSWLKKQDPDNYYGPPMRPYQYGNSSDTSATLTFNNGEHSNYRPPRKSILVKMDRKSMIPTDNKFKNNGKGQLPVRQSMGVSRGHKSPGRGQYRHQGQGRMQNNSRQQGGVQNQQQQNNGRKSLAPPSRLAPKRRAAIASILPQWAEDKIKAATPLHKSTPRDQVRSILKQKRFNRPASAAKRVNFDEQPGPSSSRVASENIPDVAPLDESTIQNIPSLLTMKIPCMAGVQAQTDEKKEEPKPAVSTVDVGTNTESFSFNETDKDAAVYQFFSMKMNEFCLRIGNVLNEMAEFSRGYKPDVLKSSFIMKLDQIQELSENATPSMSENVTPVTADSRTGKVSVTPVAVEETPMMPKSDSTEEEKQVVRKSPLSRRNPEIVIADVVEVQEPTSTCHLEKSSSHTPEPDIDQRVKSPEVLETKERISDVKPARRSPRGDIVKAAVILEKILTDSVNEKENIGPRDQTKLTSPLPNARRSARLRGHTSPAEPLLTNRAKKLKKKSATRFLLEQDSMIEEEA